jgi:hypothetical protein
LRTDKGKMLRLHLRNPGLFLPQAKEILLAHQDLEDAGVRVNYHTGVMRAPRGQTIKLDKRGAVWQVPLHTWKTDDLSGPSARRKHRAFIVSSTSTTSAATPSSVERMHQILCCAGTTQMLRYYDHYKGTGFGGASKAEIRAYRCPIKALMQGDATKKMRKPATTQASPPVTTHAHAAHLGTCEHDEDCCPCCHDAEPQPKKVRFQTNGPWPAARGEAATPPRRKEGPKPRLPRAGAAASKAWIRQPPRYATASQLHLQAAAMRCGTATSRAKESVQQRRLLRQLLRGSQSRGSVQQRWPPRQPPRGSHLRGSRQPSATSGWLCRPSTAKSSARRPAS